MLTKLLKIGELMSECFFCGTFVGEVNGDGGCKGRTVGNRDICEQCLGELKHWLNGTIPRSPSMRENKLENDEEVNIDEQPVEEARDGDGDPFSSGAKI